MWKWLEFDKKHVKMPSWVKRKFPKLFSHKQVKVLYEKNCESLQDRSTQGAGIDGSKTKVRKEFMKSIQKANTMSEGFNSAVTRT